MSELISAKGRPIPGPSELSMAEQSERLEYLDIGRGLAIVGVIAVHVLSVCKTGRSNLDALINCGQLGVQLFFVISAWTMCLTMAARQSEKEHVIKFWIRRFSRLALPYWAAMVLYLAFYLMRSEYFSASNVSGLTVLSSIFLLHGFWPETLFSIVPGGWSIGTEVAFYILFPLIFIYRKQVCTLSLFAVLAIAIDRLLLRPVYGHFFSLVGEQGAIGKEFFHFYIANQLPVFIAGMIACELASRAVKVRRWELVCLVVASVVFVLCSTVMALASLCACSLLLWLKRRNYSGVAWHGMLIWLGQRSYSFYLFHFAVINVLARLAGGRISGIAAYLLTLLFAVLATSVIAWVAKPILEETGVKLGKTLIRIYLPA